MNTWLAVSVVSLALGVLVGFLVMHTSLRRRPRLAFFKSISTDLAPANPDEFDVRYIQDMGAAKAGVVLRHLDGVAWHDVEPLPPRHHRCWVQSWGMLSSQTRSGTTMMVRRCACGASCMDDIFTTDGQLHWMNKNETMNSRARRGMR